MKIELDLKEGKCGDYELKQFTVSAKEAEIHWLRCIFNGRDSRALLPGTYWRLMHKGEIIMTNTPAEVMDHIPFIKKANGNVLVAGLGLGMVVHELLKKPEVKRITVVEISNEVIKLVGNSYKDPRLEIVNADIFAFEPSHKYDYGWYDIWNYICEDNYPEMVSLMKRLLSHVIVQDCWCMQECKSLAMQV